MDLIHLEHGRTRATIAPEAGGRLLQLAVNDGEVWLPLLREPERPEIALDDPLHWGSYVMAPWPGRVANARFEFEGRTYSLRPTDGGNAIHGCGVWRPWRVESHTGHRCTLSLELRDDWPWPARLEHHTSLESDAITQRIEIHAVDGARFPAGAGWHPWFRRDVIPGHEATLLVDAGATLQTENMIPTGASITVEGTDRDLRAAPQLGDRLIDDAYVSPRAMAIRWGDLTLTMTNASYAVVYTPPQAACLEPQTCAPDAFNLESRGLPAGVLIVEPQRPLVATTEWRWTIAGPLRQS